MSSSVNRKSAFFSVRSGSSSIGEEPRSFPQLVRCSVRSMSTPPSFERLHRGAAPFELGSRPCRVSTPWLLSGNPEASQFVTAPLLVKVAAKVQSYLSKARCGAHPAEIRPLRAGAVACAGTLLIHRLSTLGGGKTRQGSTVRARSHGLSRKRKSRTKTNRRADIPGAWRCPRGAPRAAPVVDSEPPQGENLWRAGAQTHRTESAFRLSPFAQYCPKKGS